ncbi:DUF2752 domain-containing protein [Anaerosacchariphilus polymeriproducens]|uniref:DUF2752 domain-containing protein n=1 Tax=Anaerosacchariphilus polymeriproducens TaxID=1812858 RepID=A0A371AVP3_9FIRM|nr:DUF2752 domain-containing protein [Anaerosacchariphilus polymeriproducens]RDU23601.1 DUF2752 domain-containing protein [Anaerosacchariphilus polymeriproducens]
MDSENKGLYITGWILFVIVLIAFLLGEVFSISLSSITAPCLIHSLFGLYCPGCGGTRAVMSLMKGEILQSFIYHPVVPYTAAIYMIYMVTNTIQLVSKGKIKIGMKYKDIYLWIALFIIILNCFIKNIVYIGWGIRIIK